MENNREKPFTTLNHPLILEHMQKIVELEAVLIQQEEFNPAMILEYHLQLAAIAVVACGEYEPEKVSLMFTGACEQLRAMCHEEMENQPVNFVFPTSKSIM